jgi:hypothetical protein
MNDKNS